MSEPVLTGKQVISRAIGQAVEFLPNGFVVETVANEMIRCLHRLCVAVGVEFRGP